MRRPVLPCVVLAAVLGAVYVVVAPASADLAAAAFRSDLFARHGFVVINDAWYGGHHVPAYSALMPPLGALLGPRLLSALAAVAAAGLFAALVQRAFPRRDVTLGALWFAAGVSAALLSGRVPFLLGLPFGLGALVAAQRGRTGLAVALALLTPLASPVAGAFLALAGVTWTAGTGRRLGLALAAAGLVPVLALTAIFPEGGSEPFVASAFWPAVGALLALALALPRDQRTLRIGAAAYALAVVVCFVVPTALGGNVTRLAALALGPVLACLLWPERRWLLGALALPLLYWQLMPPIRDVATVTGDPSTRAAYYEPLVARLAREPGSPRVEVPFTRAHWEAAHLAEHVPIARGWERQLDRERNPLFYDGAPLTAARYTDWLHENGIAFVALPDVALDASAHAEARLIRAGLPALEPVWHDAHWTLYRVRATRARGVSGPGPDGFVVRVARPGTTIVRVRFSPHWAVVAGAGCVSEAPDGYTRVRATRAGALRVATRVDVDRALTGATGERCSSPPS